MSHAWKRSGTMGWIRKRKIYVIMNKYMNEGVNIILKKQLM